MDPPPACLRWSQSFYVLYPPQTDSHTSCQLHVLCIMRWDAGLVESCCWVGVVSIVQSLLVMVADMSGAPF